jgi:hypothetical protein
MSKEVKQALQIAIDYMNERLEDHDCKYQRHPATEAERINILADIETVKEALAKQEQGEPVAYVETKEVHGQMCSFINRTDLTKLLPDGAKLYTTPQQRTWVGLNWSDLPDEWVGKPAFMEGAKWAERKLEEKNT